MSKSVLRIFTSMDANRLKDEATRDLLFKLIRYLEEVLPSTAQTSFLSNTNLSVLENIQYSILEYTAAGASTYTVAHELGFKPLDFIITSKTGAGNVSIDYANCTDKELIFTTTGACTFRLLYGKL